MKLRPKGTTHDVIHSRQYRAAAKQLRLATRMDTRVYDVLVIGAGPAGLLVTEQLERMGRSVLLGDAGPARYESPPELGPVDPSSLGVHMLPADFGTSDAA